MESKEFFSLVLIGFSFALVFFLILGNDGITGFLVNEETSKIILNIEDESGNEIDSVLVTISSKIDTISQLCYKDKLCEFTISKNYPSYLTVSKAGYFEYQKELSLDSVISQLDVVLIKAGYTDVTLSLMDTNYNKVAGAEVFAKTPEGVFRLLTNNEGRAYLKVPTGSWVQYALELDGYSPLKGYFDIKKPIETNRLLLSPID